MLFSILFWAGIAATTVALYGRGTLTLPRLALLALVVGLWFTLPWRPGTPTWRRYAVAVFFLASIVVTVDAGGVPVPIMLIALANLAFAYGMRAAAIVVTVPLGAFLLGMTVILGEGWRDAIGATATYAVFAAFVLGLSSATLEARRRRTEAERLAARVRELAVAEERARMARDMHDSLGHRLTVIKMGLENAERRPDDVWAEIRLAKEQATEALADARRWVRALRPLQPDGSVGGAALERLARSFDGTGITVDFVMMGRERPLAPDSELVLYRALQEGLTNALRHSGAGTVRVRLIGADDRVTLVVEDDGAGSSAEPGFGLTSLAERTRALGGTLYAGSRESGGFELRAEVPA